MKRTLLFTLLLLFVSLGMYGQKTFSDNMESYSDGYDITKENVYNIIPEKTKAATIVIDPANSANKCIVMEGLDDGTNGLTLKIGSGSAFEGFTPEDNGDYIFRAKIKTELAGKIKLTIYGTKGIENLIVAETTAKEWDEISCTFTVNTTEAVYPVFIVYSWKNQKVYIDDVLIQGNGITAIRDIDFNEISIYPNPVTDVLNIKGVSYAKRVDITDLSGRTAISVSELSGNKIDVAGLQRGVYLMKVTTDKGIKVVKLVKK